MPTPDSAAGRPAPNRVPPETYQVNTGHSGIDDVPQQHSDPAVCWLLDVRKYGLDVAALLHPAED